jgi:biopolymer transport protein ExbD
MAGSIQTEGGGARRHLNQEINMVPMIDLMVCCISFLLITAVWSHMARVNSSALVPGIHGPLTPRPPDKMLHVDARSDEKFTLTWKQGTTVISTLEVPRAQVERRYPELASKVADEWRANGSHRDTSDRELDQAVLHTSDKAPFGDIVAIIDAVHSPRRAATTHANAFPAFNVTFATD